MYWHFQHRKLQICREHFGCFHPYSAQYCSSLTFLPEHILHFQFRFLTNVICIQYLTDKIEASVNNTLEEDDKIQNVTMFCVNCNL
jgi:hypothetical protein